jgi:hypothetical protein
MGESGRRSLLAMAAAGDHETCVTEFLIELQEPQLVAVSAAAGAANLDLVREAAARAALEISTADSFDALPALLSAPWKTASAAQAIIDGVRGSLQAATRANRLAAARAAALDETLRLIQASQ